MRLPPRAGFVVAVLVVGVLLTGCSYVNRVAARLNSNGTLDFGTCDARNADSFETEWIYPDSSIAPAAVISSTPIVGHIDEGGIFIGTVDVEHCYLDEANAR